VWEAADVAGLVSLLKEDATFAMPPSVAWFQGREAIGKFFGSRIFSDSVSLRLRPIAVSGQPGFASYLHDPETTQFRAHAIHVLTVEGWQLAALTTFLKPTLFSYFGLPDTLGN